MKSTCIIFSYTIEETKWAIDYFEKNQKKEKIIILTPRPESQLLLKMSRIPSIYFFSYYEKYPKYYREELHQHTALARKLMFQFRKEFKSLQVKKISIFDSLSSLIEIEFTFACYVVSYAKFIQTYWRPQKYFFPQGIHFNLSGGADQSDFTLAALLHDFFTPKQKIEYYIAKKQIMKPKILPKLALLKQIPLFALNKITYCFLRNTNRQPEIIFFSSGMNLLYHKNVLQEFSKTKEILVLCSRQSQYDEYLIHKAGIAFNYLSDYVIKNLKEVKSNLLDIQRMSDQILNNLPRKKLQTEKVYPGFTICLQTVVRAVIQKYAKKIISQTLLADSILTQTKPKLVITTHDPGQSATPFVFAAKKHGVKSLLLTHGWHDVHIGNYYFSDYAAVWGPYVKNWYQKELKRSANSVVETGMPYFDELLKQYRGLIKFRHHISSANPVIGFLLTLYFPDTYPLWKFFEELFLEANRRKFKGTFVIRSHQHQNIIFLKKMALQYDILVSIDPSISLEELVKQSDIIVSWDTTAIYWPLIMGKSVFYTCPLWGSGNLPIEKFNAVYIPENASHFFDQVTSIVSRKKIGKSFMAGRKKYLKAMLGKLDGRASHRTANLIRKLLNSS